MHAKLTYYSTLYKRNVTVIVAGAIDFGKTGITFKSGGHGYFVEYECLRSIEPIRLED